MLVAPAGSDGMGAGIVADVAGLAARLPADNLVAEATVALRDALFPEVFGVFIPEVAVAVAVGVRRLDHRIDYTSPATRASRRDWEITPRHAAGKGLT